MVADWFDKPRPPKAAGADPVGVIHSTVILGGDECQRYSDALADVLCWFRGFDAAHLGREERPVPPPGLDRLRELNILLKRGMS